MFDPLSVGGGGACHKMTGSFVYNITLLHFFSSSCKVQKIAMALEGLEFSDKAVLVIHWLLRYMVSQLSGFKVNMDVELNC